ncbi:LacI family DNA-binding transcriptional regulator [Cellulomonas sp. RIT-PI-Y]|uniref:LacI family DNA-binding transcriptional regulator n=1 Tax=Cellulomonas sp. RIT-PI-Y TaxID=3035297 RepID=UPI0021DB4E75|nr:LacI family DNA-binding transcriptional regulator [Cellulomonas sp. RIT-PI-Y]
MTDHPRPPAMSDVAARAGVSHQTVSRVLNDHPSVRPETRDRVLAAIAELGYRRNSAARALVTRRSGAFGVLTTATGHHGPASTLLEVERAAREVGYYVSVAAVDRFESDTLHSALDHFMDQGVEGVAIIAPQVDVAEAVTAFAAPVPTVMVTSGGGRSSADGLVSVGVDQRAGARDLVRHLVGLGHRDIVHLAGPQDWFDARDRLAGWQEECAAAGLDTREPVRCDWSADAGYRAAQQLIADGLPSAILAANDQLALGVLRACWEHGIDVPGRLSVTGFDDEVGAGFYTPPLTTVRQDFAALGRAAVDALVRSLAGEPAADVSLSATVVLRASTAAPH